MSESKDAHYLVEAPFIVISAEDRGYGRGLGRGGGELLRPGSRCVVEMRKRTSTGENGKAKK